jgi:hypothetical protein
MRSAQVHRIPVVNAAGFLRGMITLNDLAHDLAAIFTPREHWLGGSGRTRASGLKEFKLQHLRIASARRAKIAPAYARNGISSGTVSVSARSMNPRVADFRAAKRVVEDVAWLNLHRSYVQAAKRLGEVLRAVEQHLDQIERALRVQAQGNAPSGPEILRIRRDHRRLLHLVESALAFVSRSEPARCQACLRKLSRSLERHEQRDRALLSLISAQADPHREGARS